MATTFPKHLKPIEPQGTVLLQQERNRATFNSNDLKEYIYGNEYLQKKARILNVLQNDSILGDKSHRYYNGRDFRLKKSLAAARRLQELNV
jgi:acyl-CoA oxidase